MRHLILAFATLSLACRAPLAAQASSGTVVIVTGEQATLPVPTLMEGTANTRANSEVADQLFLRLALRKPGRGTTDPDGYEPVLARSWSRRDSLTLAFDLDPRARWHDGVPVTAADVVFSFHRALDPAIAPSLAEQLRYISQVSSEGQHRVVIRFSRVYSEQFFDATYYVQPIPAHLLAGIPPDSLARSAYVSAPVGDGPYRWVRALPGELVELRAVPTFFLGRPGLARVIFRTATDPAARMNLLLSGEADALSNIVPPLSDRDRLEATGEFRMVTASSPLLGYLLFNERASGDSLRPHPILSDLRVRRALTLALDRRAMIQAVFGPYARVPFGPVSQALGLSGITPPAARTDVAEARQLLAQAGWRDSDGDGTLDRSGLPLRLTLNVPSTSLMRKQLAVIAQEQLRQVGVALDVAVLERSVWQERHVGGRFDIGFGALNQTPTPSALRSDWSCGAVDNVAHYCDPVVDSLFTAAALMLRDPGPTYLAALRRLEADAPAIFLYAPLNVIAVHRRFENVEMRGESPWLMLWRWRVRRGQELPRDRVTR